MKETIKEAFKNIVSHVEGCGNEECQACLNILSDIETVACDLSFNYEERINLIKSHNVGALIHFTPKKGGEADE